MKMMGANFVLSDEGVTNMEKEKIKTNSVVVVWNWR